MAGGKGQRDAAIALKDTVGKATDDITGKTGEFHDLTADASLNGARALGDADRQQAGNMLGEQRPPDPVPTPKPAEEAPKGSDPGAGNKRGGIGDILEPKPKRAKLAPKDTPEGKAQRWERYQKKMSSPKMQEDIKAGTRRRALEYDSWSKVYDTSIHQHERAAEAVRNYAQRQGLTDESGWKEEHSVSVGSKKRRIDLANPENAEGIEYKSGSVPKGPKLDAEVKHDIQLINRGWDIKWVFKQEPDQWLKDRLQAEGIPWERDPGGEK